MIPTRDLPAGGGPSRWAGPVLLLLGLVLVSTGRSLGNGFAFDDVPIILENAQIHAVSPPWVYAQQSYWPPQNLGDAYRPWTVWWFALQWGLSGGAPWVFHLGNLLLTAVATLLVHRLALSLLSPFGAVIAAALFAVHPVHVEATGNIVGQGELWMTAFSVAAALLYLRARQRGELDATARLGLAALLVLAAAAKEQGFALPALLLLVEWFGVPRRPGENRLRIAGAAFGLLAVVGAGFLAARFAILGDLGGGPPAAGLAGLNLADRALVMAPLALDWFRLLIWPRDLLAQFSPPAHGAAPVWSAAAAAGVLAVAAAAAAWLGAARRLPVAALGIGWIAVGILPVSNLPFPTGVLVAERTLLLPSVGIVLVAGALADRFGAWGPQARVTAMTAVLLLIGAGAARSFSRQAVWRDNPTLFAQTIIDEPLAYRGWFVYGRELVRRREPDRAMAMFARAGALYAGDHRVFEEWGQVLRTQGRCADAIPVFERGVAADPKGTLARSRLFECLMTERRYREAAAVAQAGLSLGGTEFQAGLDRARRSFEGTTR